MSAEEETLLQREHDDGSAYFRVEMDGHHRLRAHFRGDGTMDSAQAAVEAMKAAFEQVGETGTLAALMDLSEMHSTKMRAQFLITKALMPYRKRLHKVAVVGAKPMAKKLVSAVTRMARVQSVRFCDARAEALEWLGWEH